MKSGNLNFLEPPGPLQGCNGPALPFTLLYYTKLFKATLYYIQKLTTFKNQNNYPTLNLCFCCFVSKLSFFRNVVVISTYFILRGLQNSDPSYIYRHAAISDLITGTLRGLHFLTETCNVYFSWNNVLLIDFNIYLCLITQRVCATLK